jgi:hypothetical protein
MAITLRGTKGSELTYNELDGNFTDLDLRTHYGWRDNIVPVYADTSSPNAPVLDLFRDGIKKYNFAANELSEIYCEWHVDHDYMPGTALYPHIHWSTPSTNIGVVRWGVEYSVAKGHQQAAFPTTTTIYIEQTTTGTAYMHYIAEASEANAIPGLNIEPDTVIIARVFRDGANANDTLEANVFGLCVDMHYLADRYATPNKVPNFYA